MKNKILEWLKIGAKFIIIFFVINYVMNYFRAPKLDSNTLPTIQATLIDGTKFDSKQLTGKPLMINFWGTWCPTCVQEAGNIARVSKKYNVLTIAVNSGSNENIKKWLSKRDISYPVLNDASGIWSKKFNIEVFPTTFIYDSKGNLKFTETGYSTTVGLLGRLKLAE